MSVVTAWEFGLYGGTVLVAASSRVAALFSIARVDRRLVAAVADASPAKQGRRIPDTDVTLISPEQLIMADPDCVLLTLPDLYEEVRRSYPQLDGRWSVDAGVMETASTAGEGTAR
jgi:C-methyltransferase C-terminal domain